MAKPLFTNNGYSTLASGITDVATSLTVATGEGARFPIISGSDYFYATLIDTSNNLEIVKVTARSTDTFTVTRGQDGTSGTAFSASDRIELRPTAAGLEDIRAGTGLINASIPADTIDTTQIVDDAVTLAKIAAESVTLAKMAQMTADGFIGNDSGGAAVPQELSATEATAVLNGMVADSGSGGTKGLVPAPGTGDGTSGKEAYLTGAATYIRPIWHPIGEYVLTAESAPYAITGLTDWDMLDIDLLLDFSADGNMAVQVGYGGTPTWITGTSSYTWLMGGVRMNTSDTRNGTTTGNYLTDKIRLNDSTPDASSQYPFTCSLKFYNWSSVADYRQCQFHSTYWQSTNSNYETTNGGGTVRDSANALTAIRFDNSGGGTFTGHITIQGRKIG